MKRHSHVLLAALFFIFISETASAVSAFGIPDCGEWVQQQTQSRKSWLLGFISGLGSALHGRLGYKDDPLSNLNSADQAYLWMANYCRANPLKTVMDGAHDLFNELNK